jgi:hypothetical protein
MKIVLLMMLPLLALTGCGVHEPQQHWEGLWRADFEGSQFCPAPATECSDRPIDERKRQTVISLQFASGWPAEMREAPGGLYKVVFDGRRSLFRGHFGHMGMADREIVVDRLISIVEIEPPPPEPTRAQVIAEFKKCEAEKTCDPDWGAINALTE